MSEKHVMNFFFKLQGINVLALAVVMLGTDNGKTQFLL